MCNPARCRTWRIRTKTPPPGRGDPTAGRSVALRHRVLGPEHPDTLKVMGNLAGAYNTKSMIGGALLGQKRYAEAEPLLLGGYRTQCEAGRQALGMMDHPNIAKALNAGTTEAPVAAGILPAVEPGFQPGGRSALEWSGFLESRIGRQDACRYAFRWPPLLRHGTGARNQDPDRKSTRLNSSHRL